MRYLIALVLSVSVTLGVMSTKPSTAHSPTAEKIFCCTLMGGWALLTTILVTAFLKPGPNLEDPRYWRAVEKSDRIRARGRRLVYCDHCGARQRIPPQDHSFWCRRKKCAALQDVRNWTPLKLNKD